MWKPGVHAYLVDMLQVFSQQMINHEKLDQVWLPDPITLSSTSFLIRYSIQT